MPKLEILPNLRCHADCQQSTKYDITKCFLWYLLEPIKLENLSSSLLFKLDMIYIHKMLHCMVLICV